MADAGATGDAGAATWARAAGVAVYLGGFGYLLILLWGGVLVDLVGGGGPATAAYQVASQAAILLGAVTITGFYLRSTDRGRDYLDLSTPGARKVGLAIAGVVVLYGLNVAAEFVGVPTTEHTIQQYARDNPEILPPMMVGSLLFVGPGEELLYRNVVQKRVAESVPEWGAIAVASVVFAAVHVLAFWGATLPAFAGTLGLVFVLSVVLGTLYALTDSLAVVALTHGLYDAVAFGILYV